MSEQFIYSQKNNFSGGELTPTIEGRSELGLYQNGAKKLVNFIILPSGGVMRRHGTEFVYKFTSSTNNVPILRKIINVMFSRELSYLLVFECQNNITSCSFFVNGYLYITTTTLTHDGRNFIFKPKDLSYTCFGGTAYISFGIDKPIFKFSIDPEIVIKLYDHIEKEKQRRETINIPNVQTTQPTTTPSTSSTVNNTTSILFDHEIAANFPERNRMFIIEPLKAHVAYYKQMQNNIAVQRPFNEVIYNADIDRINDVLKGMHAASSTNIYEQKQEKLYASTLITFENRLWCFGVNKNIHLIWASYKGDFNDFRMSYKSLLEARNPLTALSATFSSATFDNVLWCVPFSTEMLLGTTDGIYLIKEGDRGKGEFIKIHKELDISVSPITPVIIGKTIFFVDGSNRKINSLYYSQEKGGFQISDITAYSEHIFHSGIKQIVGINSPFSMIFAVLNNGGFASFTYSQDLKIMGWTPHCLGGNTEVLNIIPIYSNNEDKLYFHVKRSPYHANYAEEYLEVLHTKYFTAQTKKVNKPVYLDCHINIQSAENELNKLIKETIDQGNNSGNINNIITLRNIADKIWNIIKLDIDNVDINNNFKYGEVLVNNLEPTKKALIDTILKNYYKNDWQNIVSLVAYSLTFHRMATNFCQKVKNIILTSSYEELKEIENLLADLKYVSRNIKSYYSYIRNINDLNRVNFHDFLITYIPNNAFSFHGSIYKNTMQLNVNEFDTIINMAGELQTITNNYSSNQFGNQESSNLEARDNIKNKIFSLIEELQLSIKNLKASVKPICLTLMPHYSPIIVHKILEDQNSIKFEKYFILRSIEIFNKLYPHFTTDDLVSAIKQCSYGFDQIDKKKIIKIYGNYKLSVVGDEELQEQNIFITIPSNSRERDQILKLKQPVKFLSIGFNYSSILQTFPFIFPDEVEHSYKSNVEIGIKVFNTKGGYIEERLHNKETLKQYIYEYSDLDNLTRFKGRKGYLVFKENLSLSATPYRSGWVNFNMKEQIKQDVDFTFIVDKPYPATILKIYAKAKILAGYKNI